jgi:hypothetical protein
MTKLVKVKYGIGYGTHQTDIEVEDDATEDEIEEMAFEAVRDRLWVTCEVVEEQQP